MNVLVPASVGIPLITPLSLNVSPSGSVPDATDHVIGVTPVAERGREYSSSIVPSGGNTIWITGESGVTIRFLMTVNVNCFSWKPFEFSAFTVNVDVPTDVAAPLITPLALSVNPAGSVPEVMDHVIGVTPFAVRVNEELTCSIELSVLLLFIIG